MIDFWTSSAAFRLDGDIKPKDWVDYFGVYPRDAWEKGQLRQGRYPTKSGRWSIGIEDAFIDIESKIKYLLNILKFPRDDFVAKMESTNATADMFCYCDQIELPIISIDVMDILSIHKIELNIDHYPPEEDK